MAHDRHILPSNYPPQQLSLDTSRSRLPLTDSTGNAQFHTLASTNIYQDHKVLQAHLQHPPPRFTLPTLPSQPAQPVPATTALELRRASTRHHRSSRRSRNPIAESQHYQAYRARQVKDSESDQKWPAELEDSFLDALLEIPKMGRRKFSLNGKPHGRNELISLYLWIAYCQTLPPGQQPEASKQRSRKQVSSHIQVLKGFMRGHPAYDQLFPSREAPKNGFEDSFKNDPCLRALARGELPHKRRNQFDYLPTMSVQAPRQPIRPDSFEMFMSVLHSGIEFKDLKPEDNSSDRKFSSRVHTYASSLRSLGRDNLESLPNWRSRFPLLVQAQTQAGGDLKCDLIHLEVSLSLRNGSQPDRAELWGQFEILVPGNDELRSAWRCTQSMYKPDDLYGPAGKDPRVQGMTSMLNVERYEPGVGTFMRVQFPANPWAYAIGSLSEMQLLFEQAVQDGAPYPTQMSARQYIDQISMYQEIFCSSGPDQPWKRRAMIMWTFRKAKPGEKGETSWRYLDPSPPRQSCFSPHPGPSHVVSAAMSETFNSAWAETQPMQLQPPTPYDPMMHGLVTPPQTASLQSPFPSYGYPSQHHDMSENLSFISHDTHDSESTLVDQQTNNQINTFLSGTGVGISDFDHNQNLWAAPPTEGFDNDPTFLANFGSVPSNAGPQPWESTDVKHQPWDSNDTNFSYDSHLGPRLK